MSDLSPPCALDETIYIEMRELLADQLQQAYAQFLLDTQQAINALGVHYTQTDWDSIMFICHRNQSSADTLGARHLAQTFRTIQIHVKNHNIPLVGQMIQELPLCLQQLHRKLVTLESKTTD